MPIKQTHKEPSAPVIGQGHPARDFLISFAAGALVAIGTLVVQGHISEAPGSCGPSESKVPVVPAKP